MQRQIKANVEKLREQLQQHQLDGFFIPSNDEFQSEYVPDYANRLKFMTGFTGSNGALLITKLAAIFFTDGRYLLQASKELSDIFQIHNISELYINEFFKGKIGYDPKLHTSANIAKFNNCQLIASQNLVDLIWLNKPTMPVSKIFDYPLKYAGETTNSKQEKLKTYLQKHQLDALIITDSSSICWLLNIRAHDVECSPILLSYLIFHQDGKIELFSNSKLSGHYSLAEFASRAKLLKTSRVQLDPDSASVDLTSQFDNPILREDPCLIAKACKNNIEIRRAKQVHILDGIALCKFFYWLEKNYDGQSEMSISDKLLEFRILHPSFIYPSFPTIAGFKENGAIIHYHANEETNKLLSKNGLLLIDSGGQYFGGTTDITRVIPIGKPTYQQKLSFTLVLKGHIALVSGIFPMGTVGRDLDVLARQYLWQHGKDYAHGTGHGVGSCLSVHEGPQRINRLNSCALKPGMIISNEPGYYEAGEYGIRIENLMLVKKYKDDFLQFETLSLAPIEHKLILQELLSKEEKQWLRSYHEMILEKLSPHLEVKEKAWLKKSIL